MACQRENLFLTKCEIHDKIFHLIIDSESKANVVSYDLVKNLNLQSTKNSLPYQLSWLDTSNNTRVRKQFNVNFQIG